LDKYTLTYSKLLPKYCPLDNFELEFGGEIAGFYLECPNCRILSNYENPPSKQDLFDDLQSLLINNGAKLIFLEYSSQEINKILKLAERKGLLKQIKRSDIGKQLFLQL
jgi:hypothetical protein